MEPSRFDQALACDREAGVIAPRPFSLVTFFWASKRNVTPPGGHGGHLEPLAPTRLCADRRFHRIFNRRPSPDGLPFIALQNPVTNPQDSGFGRCGLSATPEGQPPWTGAVNMQSYTSFTRFAVYFRLFSRCRKPGLHSSGFPEMVLGNETRRISDDHL